MENALELLQGFESLALKQEILSLNTISEHYGLSLGEADAEKLLQGRAEALKTSERIEFGRGILPELIPMFCRSPYLRQENYADTLLVLQDAFYLLKNETQDQYTDEELLKAMSSAFDDAAEGDVDYMVDLVLDAAGSGSIGDRYRRA